MSEKVTASERDRWRWMRRYRVWSANRKSFEYPENWVQPEKRDEPADVTDPTKPRP
jgi:hypothetical protein